jgi:hypothetical protein
VILVTDVYQYGSYVFRHDLPQGITPPLDSMVFRPVTDAAEEIVGYWCRQYTPDDIRPEWWGANGSGSDETTKLQSAINFAAAIGGGTVRLSAMYNVGSLNVPDTVSLVGSNNARTGFNRIGGNFAFASLPETKFDACGPTLALWPKSGRAAPPFTQQVLRDFEIAGNNVGVTNLQGWVNASRRSPSELAENRERYMTFKPSVTVAISLANRVAILTTPMGTSRNRVRRRPGLVKNGPARLQTA